jgi:hypothetical protein
MKIGIIVHSHSGFTYQAASDLRGALEAAGHQVTLARIKTKPDYRPVEPVSALAQAPRAEGYDALVLASPVNAFRLGNAMTAWIGQAAIPAGVPLAAFVTMGFPFGWMGGTAALGTLARLCAAKGATVGVRRAINWHTPRRAGQQAEMARAFLEYFGAK